MRHFGSLASRSKPVSIQKQSPLGKPRNYYYTFLYLPVRRGRSVIRENSDEPVPAVCIIRGPLDAKNPRKREPNPPPCDTPSVLLWRLLYAARPSDIIFGLNALCASRVPKNRVICHGVRGIPPPLQPLHERHCPGHLLYQAPPGIWRVAPPRSRLRTGPGQTAALLRSWLSGERIGPARACFP